VSALGSRADTGVGPYNFMLYIVSTPIGNLKDITFRAVETLKSVALIAAEDTRHTKILLDHYAITTPTTSYFEHNEDRKTTQLIAMMKEGKDIALVTDAGTPGISDPGYPLINAAIAEGIAVTVIPGPTALIAALNLSGLPAHNFVFEGFAPVKSGARRKKLETLKDLGHTIIFYESPHRILKLLKDIEEVLENPTVVCVREITKKFEEVKKGTAHEMLDHFTSHEPRGEFVVLINAQDT
jgi:16S rRNA (cytidine1402-2'-O)-methyltransferase